MYFRTILSSALAITLLAGGVAYAAPAEPSRQFAQFKLPSLDLPGVFGGKKQERPQLAQAGDPRVTAMEEQIRALSGTIEELNFQILQMQEQMRKMQEDNEFRFQEIEGKKTDASGATDRKAAENPAPPAEIGQAAPAETAGRIIPPASVEDVIGDTQNGDPATPGVPPKTFGTITFDETGNVTGGSVGDQTESIASDAPQPQQAAPEGQADNTVVAALPSSNNPDELYRNSYEFILSGDYGTAETGFRDHIERFPADQKAADSHFWLGESLLAQKKYRDAAEVFLAANKDYPSAKKAPDMLLKLGVSLVGLDQRDVACATFSEIGKRYPDVTGALKDRVKQEQALASC